MRNVGDLVKSGLKRTVLYDMRARARTRIETLRHYSGGFTAKGEVETPVLKEFESVLGYGAPGQAMLIDDAGSFTGEHDYPTIEELEELVRGRWPEAVIEVQDDTIRIHSVRRRLA